MSFQVGQKVGDYNILGVLGAGGMGEVYKVKNELSDRVEAMKILLPDLAGQSELAARFLREIKVLASLEHPNIAQLRTALRVDNTLVMVMEFVEGSTLSKLVENGPLPETAAVDYIAQILSALSYAHARGIIHRDIKPANMMLTSGGAVKLMDFGIARAAGETKLTMTGSTLGSIYYMSPEQVQGDKLDERSDLYSLGVSLYELVTAQHPFEGDTSFTIMKGHIEGSPVPPNQKNPALSPVLNEVILMAMARDPAHRYQTAEEFRSALLNVKEQTRFRAAAVPGPSHVANSVVPPVTAAQPPIPAAATVVTRSGAHAAPPAAATSVPATPAYATQAPVAPASSSMPVAPAAIAPVPRSYRAFYIAVGSALTILLILFTAMKLPMLHSSESVSKSAPAATPGSPAPPAGGAAAPGQPAAGAQPIPGSVVAQPPAPNTLVPSASSPDASSGGAIARRNPAVQQQNSAQSAAAAEAARKEEEARKAAEAAAAENARLLEEQENRFAHMTARANSIKDSFENLRRQQAAAGYSPDSSISTAVHTMEGFLSRADAALSNRDGTAARKFMDQAETQLQILERRFGR